MEYEENTRTCQVNWTLVSSRESVIHPLPGESWPAGFGGNGGSNCRVEATGFPVAPLSEPDRRISHPALRMISQSPSVSCGPKAALSSGLLCLAHSPTSVFNRSRNQIAPYA